MGGRSLTETVAALWVVVAAQAQAPDASRPFVPNLLDLTITMRHTDDMAGTVDFESVTTLNFKGAKQRQETVIKHGMLIGGQSGQSSGGFRLVPVTRPPSVVITLCDEHRRVVFNDDARLYAFDAIYDPSDEFRARRERLAAAHATAPGVDGESTTITDSTDTGERRQIGPFTAQHIRTNRRAEYRQGGSIHVDSEERDGWYVDLPVDCFNWPARLALYGTTPESPGATMVLRGNGPEAIQSRRRCEILEGSSSMVLPNRPPLEPNSSMSRRAHWPPTSLPSRPATARHCTDGTASRT